MIVQYTSETVVEIEVDKHCLRLEIVGEDVGGLLFGLLEYYNFGEFGEPWLTIHPLAGLPQL